MRYILLVVLSCNFCFAQVKNSESAGGVTVAGAMHRVMQQGELFATLRLDTIRNKTHLYGLGPAANLKGEIMIWDGKAFTSSIGSDMQLKIDSGYSVGAPFFVYANISEWKELVLPVGIDDDQKLEMYLDQLTPKHDYPFAFTITATIDSARIHVVNLPDGKQIKNPDDAHLGQQNYDIQNRRVKILGFFSRNHQGIFTHHTNYIHMHLMTEDGTMLGHVDGLKFSHNPARVRVSVK